MEEERVIGSFDGCSSRKLASFIEQEYSYPAIARENGIEGTTIVQIQFAEDGTIDTIQALRMPHKVFERSTRTLIENIYRAFEWTPAVEPQTGETIPCAISIPVYTFFENKRPPKLSDFAFFICERHENFTTFRCTAKRLERVLSAEQESYSDFWLYDYFTMSLTHIEVEFPEGKAYRVYPNFDEALLSSLSHLKKGDLLKFSIAEREGDVLNTVLKYVEIQ
ncbi:MAG: energy transducer TonB [Bacteroidota bacterium]